MSYNLFLDDERFPCDVTWGVMKTVNEDYYSNTRGWLIARTVEEFRNIILERGMPDVISFDHDLGPAEAGTGFEAAKWLVNHCIELGINIPDFNVHSMNPVGKANIIGLLTSYADFHDRLTAT